jgi:hypothetical protein
MSLTQDQIDVLHEHLPYELNMLAWALNTWANIPAEPINLSDAGELNKCRRNSAVETFWLHARNLHEFFMQSQTRTASADHFTNERVDYSDLLKELGSNIENINDQISHINYARTRNNNEKLDFFLAWRVMGAIGRAVKRFQEKLYPAAKDHFHWHNAFSQTAAIANIPETTSTSTIIGSVRWTNASALNDTGPAKKSTYRTG